MERIFISYKRADKDLVLPLKDQIETVLAERCWIDMKGIESDAQFVEIIMRAIEQAQIVLFMYSERHTQITNYNTDWTTRELQYAQRLGKRIVFVNIDGAPFTEWFVRSFPKHQPVDANDIEAIKQLLIDLYTWLHGGIAPEDEIYEEEIEDDPSASVSPNITYSFGRFKREAKIVTVETPADTLEIPSEAEHEWKMYPVTSLGIGCFGNATHLRSIVLPDTIRVIGNSAFAGCEIESIRIPEGVKEIKANTFSGCEKLQSVILPHSLRSIGMAAFSGCKALREITIPEGVKTIGISAFSDCEDLKNVVIPTSIRKVKIFAFSGCKRLQSIAFPRQARVSSDAVDFEYEILGEDE